MAFHKIYVLLAWWILIPSLLLENKKESKALSRKRQVHLGNSIILRTFSYTTLIWASYLLATIYFSATAAVAGIYTTVCCNKVPNQIMTLRPIIIVYQDQEDKSRRKIGLYFFHCREEIMLVLCLLPSLLALLPRTKKQ